VIFESWLIYRIKTVTKPQVRIEKSALVLGDLYTGVRGGEMKDILSEFLKGAGDRPYRELIQHHLRKQSTKRLQEGVLGEISLLPKGLQSLMMDYIDVTNNRFSYDKNFWSKANCRQAFEQIITTAIDFLPIKDRISTIQAAFKPENQEIAFQLFQIPTLSFAYSASTQRAQRKFMGIRKGILG
jgi:hypothetical protein